MKFTVLPFVLTDHAIAIEPMSLIARPEQHVIHAIDGYEPRMPLEIEADDAHAALEKTWTVYQNLDEDHLTPDDGRSLMCGDLARVTDAAGEESWWIVCSMGWHQTEMPGSEIRRVAA